MHFLKNSVFNDSFNVGELYNKNRTNYVKQLIKDSTFIKKWTILILNKNVKKINFNFNFNYYWL